MRHLILALSFFVYFSAQSQPIPVPSSWHSKQFKSITFLSDSTLELEAGFFPDQAQCNQFQGRARQICLENLQIRGIKSQQHTFHYNFTPTGLVIFHPNNTPPKPQLFIGFRVVGTHRIQLDFSDAFQWFPHQTTSSTDSTLTYQRTGAENFSNPWDSLRYNQLFVEQSGLYRLQYSRNATKTGKLEASDILRIQHSISYNAMLHRIYQENASTSDEKENAISFQTSIPSDVSSFNFVLFQPGLGVAFHGYQGNQPKLIRSLLDEIQAINDSLMKYILYINQKTIDVQYLNCLYWYRGNTIQRKDIPYDWVQWGELKQRKIYLLARDTSISTQHFDYVLFIAPEPESIQHAYLGSKPDEQYPVGSSAHKKMILKEIQKHLKAPQR